MSALKIKGPKFWRSSLPHRVVISTLASSVIVLLLGGWLLMNLVTDGMLAAKRASAISQVNQLFSRMQERLRGEDFSASLLSEQLNQLADQAGAVGDQYIIIDGPLSAIRSSAITALSVPAELRATVRSRDGLWLTPTTVHYSNSTPSVPGIAIGTNLRASISGERYPTYFVFPLTTELATLDALRQAVWSTGALLVLALALISYVVAAQVVVPVRQARQAAQRLASGQLSERLDVRGTDDIASLATSMNHMASELQRQIGKLEHLSLVQQRFVSDVSHELRTPMTTVRMAAEMLHDARERFDAPTKRAAELLQHELDRFEMLLTDLLEISRFDAGAATLALDDVDVAELVRDEIQAHASVATRHGSTLCFHGDESAVATLDARRIRRIVRNLVTNAIEHGEELPIDITVRGNDKAVALTVRDHGIGFLPSQAGMVFERFWRADPSRVRTIGGTGLGLPIALEDARLHGGSLMAWGKPGKGAQFRLVVPRSPQSGIDETPLPLIPSDLDRHKIGVSK